MVEIETIVIAIDAVADDGKVNADEDVIDNHYRLAIGSAVVVHFDC